MISNKHKSIGNGEGNRSMLSPVNSVNVNALLYHLPQRAVKEQSAGRRYKTKASTNLMSLNF